MVRLIEQLCSRDVGKLLVTWRPLEMCNPPLVFAWLITLLHHILQARFLPTGSRHFSSCRPPENKRPPKIGGEVGGSYRQKCPDRNQPLADCEQHPSHMKKTRRWGGLNMYVTRKATQSWTPKRTEHECTTPEKAEGTSADQERTHRLVGRYT